jgi:hypothetical protein
MIARCGRIFDDTITVIPPSSHRVTSMIVIGGEGDDDITITSGIAAVFGDDVAGMMTPFCSHLLSSVIFSFNT